MSIRQLGQRERERERSGAEGGEGEREYLGKYCSNLSVRGLFILSEPRGRAGGGREGWRRGERQRRGGEGDEEGEGEGKGQSPETDTD